MGVSPDVAWPAASAVLVAFFGLIGILVTQRRRNASPAPDDEDDVESMSAELNLVRSMSLLLEDRDRRILALERELAACKGREKARGF